MLTGFEPARTKSNGLAVHRLNHSAITSSLDTYLSYSILLLTFYSAHRKSILSEFRITTLTLISISLSLSHFIIFLLHYTTLSHFIILSFFFFKIERKYSRILSLYSSIMNHIIQHDISLLLSSISIQYKIDFDLLRKRYLPTISIENKYIIKRNKSNKYNKPRKFHSIHPTQHRCRARTWNNGHVSFDHTTQTWIYGAQCSRLKFGQTNHCRTHLATINRHSSLPHGDFFLPPPHPHFDKYKKNDHL